MRVLAVFAIFLHLTSAFELFPENVWIYIEILVENKGLMNPHVIDQCMTDGKMECCSHEFVPVTTFYHAFCYGTLLTNFHYFNEIPLYALSMTIS